MTAVSAYLGLGSNIEPERHFPTAMRALQETFQAVVFSPVYRSPAFGLEGDDFLNAVAAIETELAPEALLEIIEEMPRNPSGKILKKELRKPFWEGIERNIG